MAEGRLIVAFNRDGADDAEIEIAVACALRELRDTVEVESAELTVSPEAS